MRTELDPARFDYALPPERIAQRPAKDRDGARLLVLDRAAGDAPCAQRRVDELPTLLRSGDLLVVNATRVLPARLRGRRSSGGTAEALLLGPLAGRPGRYRALLRISGRLRPGIALSFGGADDERPAEVSELGPRGEVVLDFGDARSPYEVGEAPLPPYIERSAGEKRESTFDLDRYQTVFARVLGSVAAPTAGLHLSRHLLDALKSAGVELAEVVLHVGPGTFRPLQAEDLERRRLHRERFELPDETALAISRARERGGRVVAVGTTTTRVLESCAGEEGRVTPRRGETDLFLYPGCRFRVVDALLTNFHLPRSSLLYLVAAFAGRERVLAAYREAIAAEYRFYSYGDAMLIL